MSFEQPSVDVVIPVDEMTPTENYFHSIKSAFTLIHKVRLKQHKSTVVLGQEEVFISTTRK